MDALNTDNFGGSSDPKTRLMNQIRQESAVSNARQLIEKINEHCFEKCVPKPGSTFTKGEETCFTQCMEKYMASWNTVSRQYVARIQKEQTASGGGVPGVF
ncbi:MAG: protein translocase subunit [Sarea resinae]|nr:MAG: protein translocase subunit [Sarea resinae]